MRITRSSRRLRSIMLIPLIDVMFFILIFFMFSTSFQQNESMELSLPAAASKKKSTEELMRLYLNDNGNITYNQKPLDKDDIGDVIMKELQLHPDRGIILLTSKAVSIQQMVAVMDEVYLVGGRNLSVAEWQEGGHEN